MEFPRACCSVHVLRPRCLSRSLSIVYAEFILNVAAPYSVSSLALALVRAMSVSSCVPRASASPAHHAAEAVLCGPRHFLDRSTHSLSS
eukprot:scaffold275792_cov28-Tisochrysis_lutea.AAC.1